MLRPTLRFAAVCTGLTLAALPALADNSSPTGTSSDTTGFNFDPTWPKFVPGKVNTRQIELDASVGSIGTLGDAAQFKGGTSTRLHLRIPTHWFGSYDPSYQRGMLVDPGVTFRHDSLDGVGRTELQITGLGLYRWQGTDAHITQRDIDDWNAALKAAGPELNAIIQQHEARITAKLDEFKAKYGVEKTPADVLDTQVTAFQDELKEQLTLFFKRHPELTALATQYRNCNTGNSPADCAEGRLEDLLNNMMRSIGELGYLVPNPNALAGAWSALTNTYYGVRPRHSEASATGDLVLGHASYVYRDNGRAQLKQHGIQVALIEGSWHAAAQSGRTNIGFSGALSPLQVMALGSTNASRWSSDVELCLDLTYAQLPTIRQCADLLARWGGDNNSIGYGTSTTVAKKLGPVTPYLRAGFEKDQSFNGNSLPAMTTFSLGLEH